MANSKDKFKITVVQSLTRSTVGTFEYASVPRVGEWLLTPDNDGSGDMIWRVDMVLHFPIYPNNKNPEIFLYASNHLGEKLLENLEKKIVETSKRDQIEISNKIKTRREMLDALKNIATRISK